VTVAARFDEATPGSARSFVLEDPVEVIVASEPAEVRPALDRCEELTAGGLWAAGFVAYEAAPGFDDVLTVGPAERVGAFAELPLLWFGVFRTARDVAPFEPAVARPPSHFVSAWLPSIDQADHTRCVGIIRDHIADGDTYQVNLTLRLDAAFAGEPDALYRDLVLAQRGSYSAHLDLENLHVLSASPEQFLQVNGRRVTTRPMKGTARRGRWPAEDAAIAAELQASEKERAENLMIVDLIRNDLGKVARVGSVEVEELLALERYETVWQLTSQISADLREDVGVGELFSALFPSGSVTGAPKRRSMEIITALEDRPRSVYCGAVGYLSPPAAPLPDVCFNVAIRTVLVDQAEGVAEYGVGGAITWGSSAGREYEEAANKARVLVERRPDFDLIETIRWELGHGWWWLEDHLDRLEASADYFGFTIDRPGVLAACRDAIEATSQILRVRLALSRNGLVTVSADAESFSSFQMGPDERTDRVVLAVDHEPVDSGDPFLFHKTNLRDPYDERRARHPEADDVVLCNQRGEVTETTIGNLAVRFDGWWATPALDSGCLPGVMRGRLLDRGDLIEDTITLDQFLAADAVAVLNSIRGWRPATILAAVPGT